MNKSREFEGPDLDTAIRAASKELGIETTDLDYAVLEQGRRGLLGLGTKNVRIRVKPPVERLSDRQILAGEEPDFETADPPEAAAPVEEVEDEDAAAEPARPRAESVADGVAQDVADTTNRILELAGLALEAEVAGTEGGVTLKIDGADGKLLSQRRGELRNAVQFLLNRMCRRTWPDVARVQLVGEGDAKRRDDKLVSMARQAAKQVSKTGKTRKLRPMNAYERRLIHIAVREFPGLTSTSDGDGALKRVRISKVRNEINV